MNIEVRDPALQARLQKQMESVGSATMEEVLLRLLDTQEEQDRWLADTRGEINAKIQRGIDQIERGEGRSEHEVRTRLARLKTGK
ncbi:MAG: hypothetical protein ACRD3E_07540 [Terriglobales bacterium]